MDKIVMDKKLFMSSMENITEFLDEIYWFIHDDNDKPLHPYVNRFLIPAVLDLEEASGMCLDTDWFRMADD